MWRTPRLLPEIEIHPWQRTQFIAIQVHPNAARPHYLKREGAESGTYVRLGYTNRRADAEMLQELRRSARGETYNEQPMADLSFGEMPYRCEQPEKRNAARSLAGRGATLSIVVT